MKLTEKQLRNIIKEEMGLRPSVQTIVDVDTGQSHRVSVAPGYDPEEVKISFGPNFTVTVDEEGLLTLSNMINMALRNLPE